MVKMNDTLCGHCKNPKGHNDYPCNTIRATVTMIKMIARAFAFFSIVFSACAVFFFFADSSILHGVARYMVLHHRGIEVVVTIFLILVAMYVLMSMLFGDGGLWDKLEEAYSLEVAQTTMIVIAMVIMLLIGVFTFHVNVMTAPKTSAAPAPVQSRVLLHIRHSTHNPNLVRITNIAGAAKIERMGPGYYQVWMQEHQEHSG